MKNIYQDQIKEYHNWNFALNIASGGFDNFGLSFHNMIIELAPREEVDTYMGLINSIWAISLALAPMIGGFLADKVSYTPVFIIAMVSSLLSALIFILKVKPQKSVLT